MAARIFRIHRPGCPSVPSLSLSLSLSRFSLPFPFRFLLLPRPPPLVLLPPSLIYRFRGALSAPLLLALVQRRFIQRNGTRG